MSSPRPAPAVLRICHRRRKVPSPGCPLPEREEDLTVGADNREGVHVQFCFERLIFLTGKLERPEIWSDGSLARCLDVLCGTHLSVKHLVSVSVCGSFASCW